MNRFCLCTAILAGATACGDNIKAASDASFTSDGQTGGDGSTTHDGGQDGGGVADAPEAHDGGSGSGSGNGDTITVSGKVEEVFTSGGVTGALVNAHKSPTGASEGSGTTNGSGDFSIAIDGSAGSAFAGILDVTKTNELETYFHPPVPLTADQAGIVIKAFNQTEFNVVSNDCQQTQDKAKGFLALVIVDGNGSAVAGATATASSGATPCYSGPLGTPSNTATVTATDGAVLFFNLPSTTTVQITAHKTGVTFVPNTLQNFAGPGSGTAQPNAVNETIIIEQ